MPKITEFPAATAVAAADVFLLDGVAGTKKVPASELPFLLFDSIPTMHKTIYRGKNLGTSFTAGQKTAVQNGTFKDLWVGDYWVIGGVNWRIADVNYWYGKGDTAFNTNHLVIVPDSIFPEVAWHGTSTTAMGYGGSLMRTTNLAAAKTAAGAAFPSSVLTHRELFNSSVSSGVPANTTWYDSTLDLMNEIMLTGSYVMTVASSSAAISNRHTVDQSQLALFRLNPALMNAVGREAYWLRDVASSLAVVRHGAEGHQTIQDPTYPAGVRPVFAIG